MPKKTSPKPASKSRPTTRKPTARRHLVSAAPVRTSTDGTRLDARTVLADGRAYSQSMPDGDRRIAVRGTLDSIAATLDALTAAAGVQHVELPADGFSDVASAPTAVATERERMRYSIG